MKSYICNGETNGYKLLKRQIRVFNAFGYRVGVDINVSERFSCCKMVVSLETENIGKSSRRKRKRNRREGELSFPYKRKKEANRGFDNEEVAEYKDVFEYFDKAKSGFITAKNMATTLRALKPMPDEYLVDEKMEEIDRDYGGQVNFQQYLDVLHNIIRKAKKKKRKRSCYTNLSEKQMGEIKDAFTMFDHDGDGTISASELKSVMMNIGVYSTDEDIKDMVREVDEDESGQLEFPEFVQLMTRKISGAEVSNEMLEAFRYFDKDGDGTISASEIRSVMDALGEDLSDTEIEEMIAEADRKGLGGVTYEDFVKMISSQ